MAEVPLTPSVERMLRQICVEKAKPPPDTGTRRLLAELGEEQSLHILQQIRSSRTPIRTLDGYICHLAKKVSPSCSSPVPSPERGYFSPSKQSRSPSPPSPAPAASASAPAFASFQNGDDVSGISVKLSLDSSAESANARDGKRFSPQLVALGELEFRKAFLILSYIGRHRLEDVLSANKILEWKHLPMKAFELELWSVVDPKQCITQADRLKSIEWDSNKVYYYHCHVYPDGSYIFKGPFLNKQSTHLQRVLGEDNVLIVKFAEGQAEQNPVVSSAHEVRTLYRRIAKEGIFIGLRRYQFFVFKDGGKEEKKKNPTSSPVKCYFVRMDSSSAADQSGYILLGKTVHEARCLFMHIHMVSSVAKYMARLSLILSKTIKLDVDLGDVCVETIDDLPCEDDDRRIVYDKDGERCIHTDGTGYISEDLALKCPLNVSKGRCLYDRNSKVEMSPIGTSELEDKFSKFRLADSDIREPPLLMQFRMFYNGLAVKGTLLVNRKLPRTTIQIRPSMIKVKADPNLSNKETVNSLELVGTSNKPKKTNLSKYLLALLSYGGVPKEYFMSILSNALEEAQSVYFNKRAALRVSLEYGEMDDFTLAKMILCGIPLNEPCLQYRLSILSKEVRKVLKEGKLPLSECFYLMGTVDPTGTLKRDEVCIILDNGQISGKVLVFRHPGLHFGDIHVLEATYVKSLKDFVGNAKYAIFFPTKGPRSLADEMANSDFDGDMYWVSRNPQLLDSFKPSEPWISSYTLKNVSMKKPCDFSAEELEDELFDIFLTTRFQHSNPAGVAAYSWLALMDRLLTLGDDCAEEKECVKRNMLKLVDIYYHALDAPKSGAKVTIPKDLVAQRLPHFLRRNNCYKSTSILGQIYDTVESFEEDMVVAKDSKDVSTLPWFDGEVPEVYFSMWKKYYAQYKVDMAKALDHDEKIKNQLADEVILKYKRLLYEAADFEESTKKTEEIFNEALAIYQISYNEAKIRKSVSFCNFAWKVAGSALCKLYAMKQQEKTIICAASVLREVFN